MLYMNTEKTWQTVSSKPEDTYAIGEQLGRACKGGEVFLLASDLGGGKTTFTKGLAKGLGSEAVVASPTFTVSRVYQCTKKISLHHFDFYRLQTGGMVVHELNEIAEDTNAVIVIEWGEIVSDVIPLEHIKIIFDRMVENEDSRNITITYPSKYGYIFKGTI